jgi:TolB-like protein
MRFFKLKLLNRYLLITLALMVIFNSNCGGKGTPSFYINQDIDFSFIKKVAVLPFDNLTNDKFAGDIVRQVVISELLATGLVEVVVPGESIAAIENIRVKPGQPLTAGQIQTIGKALKVQAVIIGAVEKFGESRVGNISAPEVTLTLMMADTSSGSVIWSVTRTQGGAGFWSRHFGARTDTMSETVLKVVKEALKTLYAY